QRRIDTLPRSQPIICRSSSPVNAIMSEMSAHKNALKITPVKMIVSTRIARSMRWAKMRTIKIVANDAAMISKGKVNEPKNGSDKTEKTVTTDPTVAREETLSVHVSVNGLGNKL